MRQVLAAREVSKRYVSSMNAIQNRTKWLPGSTTEVNLSAINANYQ